MRSSKLGDNAKSIIPIIDRIKDELNRGYTPDYVMIVWPDADGKEVTNILGFSGNPFDAKRFDELIGDLREEFRKGYLALINDVDPSDMDRVKARLEKDVVEALDRATDSLKKAPPIKSTVEAEKMLRELIGKLKH